MIKRKWPILVLLASGAAALIASAACSLTGPDAGPRTNGCISEGCFDSSTDPPPDGSTPGKDGSTGSDAPTGFPNPIEGTSKAATLVKNGFGFTEGPVWIGGQLLFSDTSNDVILQLSADEMSTTQFRTNSGGANGNAVDSTGRLVTCEGGNRRVVRSAVGGGPPLNALASTFNGVAFNAPNDVIVRSDGNIYFTDPSYGEDPDAAAHQPKQGLYRIAPGGGGLTRLRQYNSNPNGVALSPDGNTLYVADTTANVVNYWALAADGTPSGEQKFADVTGGDGMAMDDAGNLYVAASTGVIVFDKTGTQLGTITVAEQPANCTFGGADRKTLYITARTGLYKIALKVPGLP